MVTENKTLSESSEARVPLSLVAAIVAAGVATEVVVALSENHNPLGSLPTVLMYVEAIICLFVIAATIELGRERRARKLLVAGAGVTTSALISVAIGDGFKLGEDTAAAFGALYFVWTCAICGLSLLIVAVVRVVAERRKQRSSATE
jgi:hypothetical protein